MKNQIIIDGTSGVLGRIAGFAAKQALQGKGIVIVNCEEILITGNRKGITEKYKRLRAMGGSSMRGPNFPRSPERIVKRTIRGMLPYTKERGRTAHKRIFCYNKTPDEYKEAEKILLKRKIKLKAVKLSRISKEL
ncbi:50S ribosomal protein L13 [Candidatus Pacearchaeota archaeon]|nr:50S ribosomal protein L13 [Candidatus Pacearchaeota archaeon]